MDLKENHKRFDEALDNTIPIEKYYEIIDDWIQYADDVKQPHTAAQIIKNFHITVLATGLYTEPSKICNKNISSEKTWDVFKKFLAEEYHYICELQHINSTQLGFNGVDMTITIQGEIA